MPVQYEGVRQEHVAVRTAAGVFDVSHMGEIATRGPRAGEFLQHLLSNDIRKIEPGGAQYALLCRDDGGVLDDLFTYRFDPVDGEERFLTVVNASNADSDFEWFRRQAEGFDGVEVTDVSADYAMLALQGPHAVELLGTVLEGDVPARFHHDEGTVAGVPALICRTGYTGEDGVELLIEPDSALRVWDALLEGGAVPAGLGARDTLRLEVCYPLYGNDLSTERTPIEAGLKWACALDTDFVGAQRLREQAEQGTPEQLAPFVFTGPGIPRPDCTVLYDGEPVGTVTSGTLSPCMDVGIGMAYVRADHAQPDTDLTVDVRGKQRPARVSSKPLYKKGD
jgi:aminomethyltransferase